MPAMDALLAQIERARLGDGTAIAALIGEVAHFIRRQAKKYARKVPVADFDDLYQAGQIAVGNAIGNYDPARVPWRTYAMAAAAKGIAREAAKAKRLAERYPTPDTGTEVDCETLPDTESPWDASAEGPVWGMQDALDELDPLERAVMELCHGLTGTRPLEGHEVAAALGMRRHRIPTIIARAKGRLRQILEDRGFGVDVHGKA